MEWLALFVGIVIGVIVGSLMEEVKNARMGDPIGQLREIVLAVEDKLKVNQGMNFTVTTTKFDGDDGSDDSDENLPLTPKSESWRNN